MRRVAAIALIGVAVVSAGCTSPQQRADMSRRSLVSDAAEGARLAQLIVDDQAGGTFARAHAQELADDVQKVQEQVADHGTTGRKELLDLADEVDSALGDITIHPTDHAVARDAQKALERLSAALAKVGS
jgi:hypothetical protein